MPFVWALACALVVGTTTPEVRADDSAPDEESRIREDVANGRLQPALELATERARRRRIDVREWERVFTFAGWLSDWARGLEALRHLVELDPEKRAYRLSLAQRLLWAKETKEALIHVRWLLARDAERDPIALEVATWVLSAEGDRDGAVDAATRWAAVAPDSPAPLWVGADLVHWSARWREAEPLYRRLLRFPSEADKVNDRLQLLRHDHPNRVRAVGTRWTDNVGVEYTSAGVEGSVQLPARLVLFPRADFGHWKQNVNAAFPNPPAPVGAYSGQMLVRYEASDGVWPEFSAGGEGDTAGNVAPFGTVGVRLSLWGKLFGRAWVQHDRMRVSLEATRQDIRAYGPLYSLYCEPLPWLFVSSEAALLWLSDDNLRKRFLLAVGGHNTEEFQLEPRAFVQADGYDKPRAGAVPYFTPTVIWSAGADVTARYTSPQKTLRVEGTIGFVYQERQVAVRPAGRFQWEVADHFELTVVGQYIGAPVYNQIRFDAALGYLF